MDNAELIGEYRRIYHVSGRIIYTYREEASDDIDLVVEAESKKEAYELAIRDCIEGCGEDEVEVETTFLTISRIRSADDPQPAWREMQQAGAPSLFDQASA